MDILICKLDVRENETEVLNFLHSHNILERGAIMSPSKEIWFKHIYHIQLHRAEVKVGGSYRYGLYYTYIKKDKTFGGVPLQDIVFDDVKAYIEGKNRSKHYE